MILLMLAVQLYEILRVFLLSIGYNLWCLGKCLLTSSKKFFPNLVLSAILNGVL